MGWDPERARALRRRIRVLGALLDTNRSHRFRVIEYTNCRRRRFRRARNRAVWMRGSFQTTPSLTVLRMDQTLRTKGA